MFKGRNTGDISPNLGVRGNAVSPCNIQDGVTPDFALNPGAGCEENDNDFSDKNDMTTASSAEQVEEAVWFLMRAAYGQEKKAKDYLETKGIEVFLPLQEKCYLYKGRRIYRQVSLIPNFLFVKSTEQEMKKYIGKGNLDFFHHYYVPHINSGGVKIGKGIKPLIIPQKQMDSFIKWHAIDDENKLFIADDDMKFEMNDVVKIVDGKFAGLEGFVCRIKGQSRIGIVIKGVGTIFTAYIPKGMLEKK